MKLFYSRIDLLDRRLRLLKPSQFTRVVSLLLEIVEQAEYRENIMMTVEAAGVTPRAHQFITALAALSNADICSDNVF